MLSLNGMPWQSLRWPCLEWPELSGPRSPVRRSWGRPSTARFFQASRPRTTRQLPPKCRRRTSHAPGKGRCTVVVVFLGLFETTQKGTASNFTWFWDGAGDFSLVKDLRMLLLLCYARCLPCGHRPSSTPGSERPRCRPGRQRPSSQCPKHFPHG